MTWNDIHPLLLAPTTWNDIHHMSLLPNHAPNRVNVIPSHWEPTAGCVRMKVVGSRRKQSEVVGIVRVNSPINSPGRRLGRSFRVGVGPRRPCQRQVFPFPGEGEGAEKDVGLDQLVKYHV